LLVHGQKPLMVVNLRQECQERKKATGLTVLLVKRGVAMYCPELVTLPCQAGYRTIHNTPATRFVGVEAVTGVADLLNTGASHTARAVFSQSTFRYPTSIGLRGPAAMASSGYPGPVPPRGR
jgi:hypothetical protein